MGFQSLLCNWRAGVATLGWREIGGLGVGPGVGPGSLALQCAGDPKETERFSGKSFLLMPPLKGIMYS